jgi:hypothetical protein
MRFWKRSRAATIFSKTLEVAFQIMASPNASVGVAQKIKRKKSTTLPLKETPSQMKNSGPIAAT